jgi:GNAT superfamily N-acetyltransferase
MPGSTPYDDTCGRAPSTDSPSGRFGTEISDTICALFARRRSIAREAICGAKPRLSDSELAALARIDDVRHRTRRLRGRRPTSRRSHDVRDGTRAEVAFAVADVYQGRGIGSTLGRELAADARAAGIRELVATVCGDNARIVSLLKRLGPSVEMSWSGREREFVVGLA